MERDGQEVLFTLGCQAGTYIRKWVHDLGSRLEGAHMAQLIRTKAGPFNKSTMITLQDLSDEYYYWKEGNEKFIRKIIQPVENAVGHMSKIWVLNTAINALCHGRDLGCPGISRLHNNINPEDKVAVMRLKNELIAIGDSQITSIEMSKKKKGIAVKINKVFMKEGIY